MKDISELMLDRIIKQAEKIVEQNLRIKELEQQLAVVQEREATKDHPQIDVPNPVKAIWDKSIKPMDCCAKSYVDQHNFSAVGKQVDSFYSNSVAKESEANKKAEQHAQAAETVAEAESLPEIPDGFIRHDGGACPVNRDATVVAYLSSGRELFPQRKAHQVEWHRCSGCHDVIAYKVIEE